MPTPKKLSVSSAVHLTFLTYDHRKNARLNMCEPCHGHRQELEALAGKI